MTIFYSDDGAIKQAPDHPDKAKRVFRYDEPKGTGEPATRRKADRQHPKATGPDQPKVYHPVAPEGEPADRRARSTVASETVAPVSLDATSTDA